MITFDQVTPTAGDCTAYYRVQLSVPYTVKDFVDEILTKHTGDWGCISIVDPGLGSPYPYCRYSHGKLETGPLPECFMTEKIKSVNSHGGWTLMNYFITLEEKQ